MCRRHARALLGACLVVVVCQGCFDGAAPHCEVVSELAEVRVSQPDRQSQVNQSATEAAPIPAVVYIPTPHDIVERMLQLAEVGPDDVVYDLGCGDGRVVIAAAERHGCRAVGCDIDPRRVEEARANVHSSKVEDLVEIRQEDLFQIDLSPATVITLYLTPGYNTRLLPQLAKTKPGTRIVSHMFEIKGAVADRVLRVESSQDGREHVLYLYTTRGVVLGTTESANREERDAGQQLILREDNTNRHCRVNRLDGYRRHPPFSIRYRCVLERRISALPTTAGDPMQPASSSFLARTLNSRPGFRTVVVPASSEM